ncbi:hypothetical protein [Roseibium sp.]|uniref:hypothetical protein n=1 Tax=Roseibium sp. TaxID=1936156 RepID=UPI003B522DB3
MSNDYYGRTENLTRNTGARPDQISRELDGVVAGFDKLPPPSALSSGAVTYFEDVGTANAYVVEVENGPTTPTKGTAVSFYAGNGNTGAATLKYGSWDPKALRRLDGTELFSGDIKAGQQVEARYQGSYWTVSAMIVADVQAAIDAAQTIETLRTEIVTIGSISTELVEVHANLAALVSLHSNMATFTTVANNLENINAAAEQILPGLTAVNARIDAIDVSNDIIWWSLAL